MCLFIYFFCFIIHIDVFLCLLFFKNKSNVHQLLRKKITMLISCSTHRNEPSFCTICLILKTNDRYKISVHTEDEQRKSHILLEAYYTCAMLIFIFNFGIEMNETGSICGCVSVYVKKNDDHMNFKTNTLSC